MNSEEMKHLGNTKIDTDTDADIDSRTQLGSGNLNPIFHLLLTSIGRYQKLSQTLALDPGSTTESLICLLKAQIHLLRELQTTLFDEKSNVPDAEILDFSKSLSLPLMTILSFQTQTSETYTSNPAHLSAVRTCIQTAATMFSSSVLLMDQPLLPKQSLDYITVCTLTTTTPTRNDDSLHLLDRGVECERAILDLIKTLFSNSTRNGSMDHTLMLELIRQNVVSTIVARCVNVLDDRSLAMNALKCIDSMLASVNVKDIWQRLFPGLFVGLCRIARGSDKAMSSDVISKAIYTMSVLFARTCSSEESINDTKSVMNTLRSLHLNSVDPPESVDVTKGVNFEDEINARLPAVLPALLNSLQTSTFATIRLAATELCQSSLVDICSVLIGDSRSSIERCTLDACMIMTRDCDKQVSLAATAVLKQHRESMGVHWECYCSETMSVRMVDMIGMASTFAISHREAELRATLNLIAAYLASLGGLGRVSFGTETMDSIIDELQNIFEIDFDSTHLSSEVILSEILDQSDLARIAPVVKVTFRYLGEASLSAAKGLIQALTAALGQKQTFQLIDAAIADLFRACSQRVQQDPSRLYDVSQVCWLHEWVSTMFIVSEMLEYWAVAPDGRESRRKLQKRVGALAGAVLPILTTAPLWTLPSKIESDVSGDSSSIVSALALKSNAVLLCLIARIIGTLIRKMGSDAKAILSLSLFPLIEKTSSSNHSFVKHEAIRILNGVAATYNTSIQRLVEDNFDYVFASLLTEMSRHGGSDAEAKGSRAFCNLSDLVTAILSIIGNDTGNDFRSRDSVAAEGRSVQTKTKVLRLIEVVRALTTRFDSCSRMALTTNECEVMLTGLLDVYIASLKFIKSTLYVQLQAATEKQVDCDAVLKQCMKVLEPFRNKSTRTTTLKDVRDSVIDNVVPEAKPGIDFSQVEVDAISLILARCGFALSSPSLKIKVASVATQTKAFGLLELVAVHQKVDDKELAGGINQSPRTAVFRQINDSWPSVISGLATYKLLHPAAESFSVNPSLYAIKGGRSSLSSSQYFFLGLIFDLITSMSGASDDFIVGRLKEDVWPILQKLIGMFHGQNMISSPSGLQRRPELTGKEKLIMAILRFLTMVFGRSTLGRGLAGMIESTGTLTFPLLAQCDPIGSYAMDALKAMLRIDSDALRRALYSTSGHAFSSSFVMVMNGSAEFSISQTSCSSHLLQQHASQLIKYVESLPEQLL